MRPEGPVFIKEKSSLLKFDLDNTGLLCVSVSQLEKDFSPWKETPSVDCKGDCVPMENIQHHFYLPNEESTNKDHTKNRCLIVSHYFHY